MILISKIIKLSHIMFKGNPYANKVLQKREQQKNLETHLERIEKSRPNTTGLGFTDKRVINNNKKYMIQENRFTDIERQNRLLLEKITTNMSKRSSFDKKGKMNKSLNSGFRRKQMQNIEIENAKLLRRIQERKPNYETNKFHSDWRKQKQVIKNMANFPLVIKDKYKTHESRSRKAKSIMLQDHQNSLNSSIEMMRVRNIDGVNMIVTLKLDGQKLTIIGDDKKSKDVKLIEINRGEALQFIEEQCQGKIQRLFDRLKYQKQEGVLYLLSRESQLQNELEEHPENEEEDSRPSNFEEFPKEHYQLGEDQPELPQ